METPNELGYLESVQEFHQQMKMPILDKPTLISIERFDMRLGLIREETDELEEAFEEKNLIGVLDALCDILYVVFGMILELGFKNVIWKAYKEVHRSNMSKLCKDETEMKATIQLREKQLNVKCYSEQNTDGTYRVMRSDGKLMKSSGYSPANLRQFV